MNFSSQESSDDLPPDINAIPDLDKLSSHILDYLEYINSDEMVQLQKNNLIEFEKHINEKFIIPDDREDRICHKIFHLLNDPKTRKENLREVIKMLEQLKAVKNNQIDIMTATEEFREKQNEKFVYPHFGGKENFETEIKSRAKNKKS